MRGSVLFEPVQGEKVEVEEVDYSVFVHIRSKDCCQTGIGLIFTFIVRLYRFSAENEILEKPVSVMLTALLL